MHGHDSFGDRNYYELPGGGVNDGESLLEAAVRELKEEVGYASSFITELGRVDDFYNKINRENHNYYFLMRAEEKVSMCWEEREKMLISEILWLSIDEIIERYQSMAEKGLAKLVKARELPILLIARDFLCK